jgi:hypothetical protein
VKVAARVPFLLGLLLAAVFALAACGGESKEDFISDADAICKDAEEKTDELEDPQNVEEVPEWADEVLDIAEESQGELEDLDPPSEVEDDFNTYLDNIDEGIELFEEVRDAGEAGDEERVQELLTSDEIEELDDENEELAKDIGFNDCGQEGSDDN